MNEEKQASTTTAVQGLVDDAYGLAGRITRLAGENENYLLEAEDGRRLVLKLAGGDLPDRVIDLERRAVEAVHRAETGLALPRILPTRSGEALARARESELRGRLLTFVPGEAWCRVLPTNPQRLIDFGRKLAAVDVALGRVIDPAAERTHEWDLTRADEHREGIERIVNPVRRRALEWAFHLFAAGAKPMLAALPHSLIHGDVNDDNVLVRDGVFSGLLDFGDCLINPTICDLAIALAYHTLDEPAPLDAGARIVAGYHTVRPLSTEELEVLFPLVCARLAVSVTISAARREVDAERESWFVSEERAWNRLLEYAAMDPAEAARSLARGTGLRPWNHGPREAAGLLEDRQKRIGPSVSLSYNEPLRLVRGIGPYLYDDQGRRFWTCTTTWPTWGTAIRKWSRPAGGRWGF